MCRLCLSPLAPSLKSSKTNKNTQNKRRTTSVLYRAVATKSCDGVPTTIDAVVTTSALVSASVLQYESGAGAQAGDNFFEVSWCLLE